MGNIGLLSMSDLRADSFVQCIKLFNYVCFNAFGPFLRELCCVAYRLAASVIVGNTPVKPEKALGKMAAPGIESSPV